ncbi:hypothetical protein D7V93_27250 [Corallococcus llansteffanensis]|uniref:Uncharacterized protein n=1 Tax=Corallococcus llansteffanensis TaxID=2316731 RepID=A0A3A8PHL2_9BACT|nr:hypothetical protein D7V93_27250 [Corallococcus llansteffanensis]
MLGLGLQACVPAHRIVPHASQAEADRVEFPQLELPEAGRVRLDGNVAAAIQLAMEDFLPWDAHRKPVADRAPCLDQWESYDVTTAVLPESVLLVRFEPNLERCASGQQFVELVTYAIEVRTMGILSIESHPRLLPRPPVQGVTPP